MCAMHLAYVLERVQILTMPIFEYCSLAVMLNSSLAVLEPLSLATSVLTQARLPQRICQAGTNEAAQRA